MKNKRYLKRICLTLLLSAILITTGCKKKETIAIDPTEPTESQLVTEPALTNESEETESIDEETIVLSEAAAVYEEGSIKVRYPAISGFANEEQETKINTLIKDFATAFITADDAVSAADLEATVDYQIVSLDRQNLTVIFTGEKTVRGKAAGLEYYLTLDMRNGVTKRLFHYVDPYQLGEMMLSGEASILSDDSSQKANIQSYLSEIGLADYEEMFKAADFDQSNPTAFPRITSYDAGGPIIFTYPVPAELGGYARFTFTPDTK